MSKTEAIIRIIEIIFLTIAYICSIFNIGVCKFNDLHNICGSSNK